MRKVLSCIFLIFILLVPLKNLRSQHQLRVEITNLRSSEGKILLQLLDEEKNELSGYSQSVKDHKCTIIIRNLPPGVYAFRFFHDENSNNELDTNWLGLPKEGYGFSNNAKGSFGPPAFEEWLFVLQSNRKESCEPHY